MNKASELKHILSLKLDWNKARLDFFSKALISLFVCKTINFKEIAVTMPDSSSRVARYKRIYRFFANFDLDYIVIAKWLFDIFFSNSTNYYISIDRTNWFWGRAKINIFMLSICHEGMSIPIFWTMLNKAGMSTAQEQISLISKFTNVFGSDRIEALLADREFPNRKLVSWLVEQNITFYMRLKHNVDVNIKSKKFKSAGELFNHLAPFEHSVFGMRVNIWGSKVYLAGSKNSREDLMIIITNGNPKIAVACYLRRWEIETLFQCLKGRGFRFEDTHVTDLKRIKKIVAMLAIGVAWAHKTGEWLAEKKPIQLKNIRGQLRPQYSLFRYGLDYLRDLFTQEKNNIRDIRTAFNQIVTISTIKDTG